MSGEPGPKSLRLIREAEGYLELDLPEEALERARLLAAEGELEFVALSLEGECLRRLERFEPGANVYERLLELDPDNVGAYVGLGWCRKRSGRLDLALRSMEQLLERRPEEPIGLYNYACYLSVAGDREAAMEYLARAVGVDEDFRKLAGEEEDFDPVRADPRFAAIVGRPGEAEA